MAGNSQRLLVCGSSKHSNYSDIDRAMSRMWDKYGPFDFVITGGAPHVDTVADDIARERGWDRIVFPANWEGRGRSAGHVRNSFMMKYGQPTHVLGMPGGPGTAGMLALARKAYCVVKTSDELLIRRKKLRRIK